MQILSVDIGTTSMKMGVFSADGDDLSLVQSFSEPYPVRTYNDGLFSDIEQENWMNAFVEGCKAMQDRMRDVDVIALSGTTPGLTAMDKSGKALLPAILMLDQRSRAQAAEIIDAIGLQKLLETTGNMPVAGGCSLASILWIRDNHRDLFKQAAVFGHSNTYIARWLTGRFAIDPSSASLTALYNTVTNDLTWNADIAGEFGLTLDRLPDLLPSHESTGRVEAPLASCLGLKKRPPVVIGGNDAVLAAYSVGIQEPGEVINVNGTCEITLVCLPRCLGSTNYNVRAHVIPDRWLTLYVMNAGGKALDWFRTLFCADVNERDYYENFLPQAVDKWLDRDSGVTYVPYLMGSRYSLDPLKAEIQGLTHETSREEILAAVVKGLCEYQREHLKEIGMNVPLAETVHVTGGAVNPALMRAKKKWMRDCDYIHEEQSSLKGAAMLARHYLENS